MTLRKICFTSRQRAEALQGDAAMAVISITDPGTPKAKLDPAFHHVLRLAFFDAQPADEYLPAPIPGLFDRQMAEQISQFVHRLQAEPLDLGLLVHCEFGVSRSAAVALFAEAVSGAPLEARAYAHQPNLWVIERLQQIHPDLDIDIPLPEAANERRLMQRA